MSKLVRCGGAHLGSIALRGKVGRIKSSRSALVTGYMENLRLAWVTRDPFSSLNNNRSGEKEGGELEEITWWIRLLLFSSLAPTQNQARRGDHL